MSSDIVRRTSKLPFCKISHTDFALVERQSKKKLSVPEEGGVLSYSYQNYDR